MNRNFWLDVMYSECKRRLNELFKRMDWTLREDYFADTLRRLIPLAFPQGKLELEMLCRNRRIENSLIEQTIKSWIDHAILSMLAQEKNMLPICELFKCFQKKPKEFRNYFFSYAVSPKRHYRLNMGLLFPEGCDKVRNDLDIIKDVDVKTGDVINSQDFIRKERIFATRLSVQETKQITDRAFRSRYSEVKINADTCNMRIEISVLILLKSGYETKDIYDSFSGVNLQICKSVIERLSPFLGENK